MSKNPPITLTVPEAGKKSFGLSRNGSYARQLAATSQRSESVGCCACQCARSKKCSTVQASRQRERRTSPTCRQRLRA